jgi:hypothetical protein
MTEWPKEWVEAVQIDILVSGQVDEILHRLSAVGALAPVPKKREFWQCEKCGAVGNTPYPTHLTQALCCGKVIHYVESEE